MVNIPDLVARFKNAFPDCPPKLLVRAPGRVNLIGEHIDYNDGFVLPIAMTQAMWMVAGSSDDGTIAATSTAYEGTTSWPAAHPGPPVSEPKWSNYLRGVSAFLAERGVVPTGCRLLIHSEVPIGGGVSSSAALEVGSALAFLGLANATISPVELALLARRAEHEYAKSPCGIMDQFIVVLGKAGTALLLDCRSQEYQHLPFGSSEAELLVMNTQVKHEIGGGEYGKRQDQCRHGLALVQRHTPGLRSWREVSPVMLEAHQSEMDQVVYSRCRHTVTEIERTLKAADSLKANDLADFGKLMYGSHESLSRDYAVSCPELDTLVEVARGVPGVYGARMTGGGFGGCAIALIRPEARRPLEEAIRNAYDTKYEKPAIVYSTKPEDGATVQSL